ncbi:DUF1178 family protein [Sabulicella rubraurantiaca]|uniref:DUF1178 family protein n=1 Tax=Sabulicella rubraurantiaca TaxID=2811429 RepID=UPI001A95F863|nr:DUF1178 family protein [Sabulicella rubraurantiaca]
MIRFALRCAKAHEFESWFKDGGAYDRMATAGLVECPVCGDTKVAKALMTPRIAKTPGVKGRPDPAEATPPPTPAKAPAPAPAPAASGAIPAQVLSMLQRLRAEVEKNCDYVGRDFAEEARRIHNGESENRGIYGEASEEEAEALREEGIGVASLPWVPRSDG